MLSAYCVTQEKQEWTYSITGFTNANGSLIYNTGSEDRIIFSGNLIPHWPEPRTPVITLKLLLPAEALRVLDMALD